MHKINKSHQEMSSEEEKFDLFASINILERARQHENNVLIVYAKKNFIFQSVAEE